MTDEQKEFWKTMAVTALIIATMIALATFCGGCMSENTGSSTVVGEQMILPEITDSSDNIGVRVFEDIKGARVWTAKDSKVTIRYFNSYTNSYFGIANTKGSMALDVDIEPLATEGCAEEEAETNEVSAIAK